MSLASHGLESHDRNSLLTNSPQPSAIQRPFEENSPLTLSKPRIGKPFFRVLQPMEAFSRSGDLLGTRTTVRHITSLSLRAFLCGIAISLFAASVNAQFNASLQGSVTDQSGAVIQGATVTLTSTGTDRTQQVTSTREGFYRFSGLAPGRYIISVEQTGFNKQTLENVIVSAEETQGLNIMLQTGAVTATDTHGAQLETANANVDRVFTTTEIRRLPQTGRDPFNLLRLSPGVFGDAARASGSGNAVNLPNTPGPGGSNNSIFQSENQPQISAAGQRVTTNDLQLDGISINSLQYGGTAVITPNQESVKEILVSSSSFSAQDGRNSGAQIRIVSQNGTNQFHGSGFFKYDSPKLNAFNQYYGNSVRPALPTRVEQRYKQYGASLGGPLYLPHFGKDKLFFFFSYEDLTNNSDNPYQAFVETPQYRQQVIAARPDGITARVFQSPGIQPRIISIIPRTCAAVFGADAINRCRDVPGGLDLGSVTGARNTYLPLGDGIGNANIGGGFDGVPDIVYALLQDPTRQLGNQFNLRSDYNLNSKNQITFSSYFTLRDDLSADVGSQSRPGSDVYDKPLTYVLTGVWVNNLSSATVNEFRTNFTRFASNQVQASPNTNFGIPNIQIEGVPFNQIRFGTSRSETTPAIFSQNTLELADTATRVFGNHAVNLGGSFLREFNNNELSGGTRPLYSFVGFFNLANDTPIFEAINASPTTGAPANAQRELRSNDISVFVQDDWKLMPNLTLNLGLRYEYFSPLVDEGNRQTNLQFGTGTQTLTAAKLVSVKSLADANKYNFGPRVGFAYSLKSRVVIRGGFGIYYNRIPDVVFANAAGNPPFFSRYNICCGTAPTDFGSPFVGGQILYALGANNSPNSYPANPALAIGINPATGLPNSGSVEIYGSPRKVQNANVYKYSVDLQYEMPYKIVTSIGYEGNESRHLIRLVNENFLYQANPGISAAYFATPDVNANYNGLNLWAGRRFGNYQIAANYRFSKSLDELSNEGPGAVTNQTYPVNLKQEYGPSDFDVEHNFNLSGTATSPFFRDPKTLTGKLLGGFDLSGILTYHTGFPWTPKLGQSIRGAGGDFFGPVRPIAYYGGVTQDTSNSAFLQPNGYFPGGGSKYFSTMVNNDPSGTPTFQLNPPGIGRNTFRGPRYFDVDISIAKRFGLPRFGVFAENPNLEFRANFFNIFNTLNLAPFGFFSSGTFVNNANFGEPDGALAGRVVELQVRVRF